MHPSSLQASSIHDTQGVLKRQNLNSSTFQVQKLISICFILECMIRYLVRLMALLLSHLKGMCSKCNPKSESCCLSHKIYAQQLLAAMYSALTIDKATHACFLLFQDTRLCPNKWQVPLVLFLSSLHLAKSESEYPTREIPTSLGYHKLTSKVPLRYFITLLTAEK